jgi:hypothetical protein
MDTHAGKYCPVPFWEDKIMKKGKIISNHIKTYICRYNALLTLYYALVHSHLTYCFGCANQHNIRKITSIQKKAISTIINIRAKEHTTLYSKNSEYLDMKK